MLISKRLLESGSYQTMVWFTLADGDHIVYSESIRLAVAPYKHLLLHCSCRSGLLVETRFGSNSYHSGAYRVVADYENS